MRLIKCDLCGTGIDDSNVKGVSLVNIPKESYLDHDEQLFWEVCETCSNNIESYIRSLYTE